MAPPDSMAEAEARYRETLERHAAIRAAWGELGEPLLAEGSTGQLVEHPLVKMLREHEVLLEKLALPLRKRHRGPAPSAVVNASIGASPAARLRQAK